MKFTSAVLFFHLLQLTDCNGEAEYFTRSGIKMVVMSRNQHKAEKQGGYACYVKNHVDVSVESFRARGKKVFKAQNKATEGIWQVDVKDASEITNNNTFGVFGCEANVKGRNFITKVSTVRIQSNAQIVPIDGLYTKTVSIGDTGVTLSMNVSSGDLKKLRWRNNTNFWNTCNNTLECENVGVDTFNISEAIRSYHAGIYECNFAGARANARHGMVILIVRGCPSSKWGEGICDQNCTLCLNGGQCDEDTGKCVCPPGFKGDDCSLACGGNRFGYECEKKCNPTLDCPDKCRGYLFCLNHPLGCRCGTGWKGLDCNEPCSEGTYGANCLQNCNCASNQSCDRYTGKCQENSSSNISEDEETSEECACHEDDALPAICDDQCKICRQPWYTETCGIGIKNMTVEKVNPDSAATVSCILSERVSNISDRVTLSRNGSHLNDSGISPSENTSHIFLVSNASDSDEVSCHVWNGNSSVGCIQRKLVVYELPVLSSAPSQAYRTETSITIKWKNWDPDNDYGEGPVIAYIPYYKNESAEKWLRGNKVSFGDKEPKFEATGLNNDTFYVFSVATVREGENGEGRKGPEVVLQPGYDFPWHIVIIAAGGSLIILLLLMTLVFLRCYRRKWYRKSDMTQNRAYTGFEERKMFNHYDGAEGRKNVANDRKQPDLKLALITKEVDSESDDDFSDDDYDLPSPEYQPNMSKPQPIRITEFHEYMKQNSRFLGAEFKLLKKGKQHPWTVGEREENKEKNRFRDLYAYDHSRVELKRLPNDYYSDYYNASFIKNQIGETAFIAAQGPNRASLNDFWRMIWEQKVSTVAMVTNLFKGSKRRCSQYWPDKEGCQVTFGTLQVEWTATDFHSNYIIRTLKVSQNNQHHKVCQLHFLTWPDENVPEHPTPFIEFVNRTKQVHADIKTPMLVHCSAGLGKTGTFIALYSLMAVLQNDIYIDVFYFVEKMRGNRINMIQSPSEYMFLHKCLIEYHLTRHTEMDGDVLARIDVDLKGDILSEEFELMRHFKEEAGHRTTKGGSHKNSAKNRFHDILPVDENIPNLLIDEVLSEDETYINATLVNSFHRRNAFITTQSPLPNTVVDFWKMVYDQKCPLIVMLNQLDPNDKTCPHYWPENGTRIFGKMTITCTSVEDRTNCIFRVFEVSHDDFKNIHEVHHLQLSAWPPEMSYLGVLQLVEEVEMLQDDYTGTAPTVVHCIDGVGRCGIFVAVNSEMERLADTGKLNLFSTLKQLRARNPHILAKWKDYYLCYKILSCLVQEEFSYDDL